MRNFRQRFYKTLNLLIFMLISIGVAIHLIQWLTFLSQDIDSEDNNKWIKDSVIDITFTEDIFEYPINTVPNTVPNIVHYILFTVHEIQFSHFISILSVLKNQKPKVIYIHCDCHQLKGDYYKRSKTVAKRQRSRIIVRQIAMPSEIFGRKLSERWKVWHASDVTRLQVLQQFGGIYLDRDVYVVKSLEPFFEYETTLDFEMSYALSSQVIIARKNSRFLHHWLNSYHHYDPNQWYYNIGVLPVKTILKQRPELIHRTKKGVFASYWDTVCPLLYMRYDPQWIDNYYTIHLFIRGNKIAIERQCLVINNIKTFDEQLATGLNVTFGEMTRIVLNYEKRGIN